MDRLQTYWSAVARFLWPALFGLLLGAAVVLWHGTYLWPAAGAVAAAALLSSFLAREGRLHLLEQRTEIVSSAAGFLTPLAREVLAHLPDPLMLLDAAGRVLFANSA